MKTTKTKKQKRQLDKRLQAYSNKARTGLSINGKLVAQSAMAVGAVLVAGGVQGQTSVPLPMGTLDAIGRTSFYRGVDLDGDAAFEVYLYGINSFFNTGTGIYHLKGLIAINGIIGVFPEGQAIPTGPAYTYAYMRVSYGTGALATSTYGPLNAVNRYVGVTFNKGGTDYYGWLEIVYDPLPVVFGEPAYTLVDFYISDSPVVAGEKDPPVAVPLSPLALGVTAGLMGLYTLIRNRKRNEKVEA